MEIIRVQQPMSRQAWEQLIEESKDLTSNSARYQAFLQERQAILNLWLGETREN